MECLRFVLEQGPGGHAEVSGLPVVAATGGTESADAESVPQPVKGGEGGVLPAAAEEPVTGTPSPHFLCMCNSVLASVPPEVRA